MKGERSHSVKREAEPLKLGLPENAQLPEASRWAALAAFLTERPIEAKLGKRPLRAVPGDDEISVKTRFEDVLRGRHPRRVKA
ncbi:MAG: hypothetical protein ACKVPX_16490 [Myxococcaceae bacterium]